MPEPWAMLHHGSKKLPEQASGIAMATDGRLAGCSQGKTQTTTTTGGSGTRNLAMAGFPLPASRSRNTSRRMTDNSGDLSQLQS